MKVTSPLFRHLVNRLKDASWQRWRKRKILDDGVEAKLRESGIQVVDAMHLVQDLNPLYKDLDALPDVEPIFPQPPKEDSTHPNWQEPACKMFDSACFPLEGVNQAQAFTKSVQVKKGLPDFVMELGQNNKLVDQDALVERIIKHAFLWDATLDKLPKLRDLDIPSHGFPRKYGIRAERSNNTLIRDLLRLCESLYPNLTGKRVIAGPHEFRVDLERHGFPVQFKLSPMVTIMSKDLLSPAGPNIDETKGLPQPDISPFNSVINFEKKHIYEPGDLLPFTPDCPFPYIHTSAFSHHIPGSFTHNRPRWTGDRYSGCTVLYNFATALLMARRAYGADVKELPAPITTQVIHFTGKMFQFGIFQLNTLDLENTDPTTVKNTLWLTERMTLFENCHYVLGRGVFEGYNPEVFKCLMGIYANGAASK